MKKILENYDLLFAMTLLTALAILLKCTCAIIYQILMRDASQITSTKNKWLKAMSTKFEACYKLKISIYNPSCFVEHYLEKYRFLGISMKTLENTDYFCGLLVTCATLFSIMYGIYYELPVKWIIVQSMTLVLFLLFLITGEFFFQVRRKRKLLQLQLLDYFENTMRSKLENQYLHPEQQQQYQNEYFDVISNMQGQDRLENMVRLNEMTQENPPKEEESGISPDMQELIDSLLEENKITEQMEKLEEKQEKLNTAVTTEKLRLVEEIMKEYL